MLQENIISNIAKLPAHYQQEILDFSNFLLSKIENGNQENKTSRGGYGSRKGDYMMSDDFDEPLEDFKDYL
jgi:hypothetical protein